MRPGLVLPALIPPEPDWADLLPASGAAGELLRADAAAAWHLAADVLGRWRVLSELDATVLADFAVCSARVLQVERDLVASGLKVGAGRNLLSATAADYRTARDRWAGELGITRATRERLGIVDHPDDGPAGIYDT